MTNESELKTNAHSKPNWSTATPANSVPSVRVAACVVWVSELAMWSSSGVVMVGRIAERQLLKKGEANMSNALKA